MAPGGGKPKLLVIGRNGQVATAFANAAERSGQNVVRLGRPRIDLAQPEDVAEAVAAEQPDVIINAAAYTAVDQAEDEPDLARRVNALSAGEISRGAAMAGAAVVHLSTDYVFDGIQRRSYREDDPVNPVCVYGRTKLEGEERVRSANPRHLIVRTSWVFSPYGTNFVKTMLRLGAERRSLNVVDDQLGCPTSADDLAAALLTVAEHLAGAKTFDGWGVYHLAGAGSASWYDLARCVFESAGRLGHPVPELTAVTSEEYPCRAVRPTNSRLDCSRFAHEFGLSLPYWPDAADRVTQRILKS